MDRTTPLKTIFCLMFMLLSPLGYAAKTNWSEIYQINYNASADYLFFVTQGKWQVVDGNNQTLCSPYYVQVSSAVAGRDKLMSIGLAAKLAGLSVEFHGECSTDPAYFNATYIIVR